MDKGRKKHSLRRITLLSICLLVVGYLFTGTDLFAREEQEADYNESLDSETFTEHPIQLAGFDELPTLVDEERLVENLDEPIQEFSFVNKTFQTTINQPVLLQFSSTLPADEVLIRVPESGQIATEYLTNGEVVKHSHGEYWHYQTTTEQTHFTLPVLFDNAGKYFLTIDHDADHFYLEVIDAVEEQKTNIPIDSELAVESYEEKNKVVNESEAREKNLVISEELIKEEEERIFEETRNPHNRSESYVSNWSQFRSAWNSSRTSGISVTGAISFSSSILGDSLNARTTSISLTGANASTLDFLNSGNSLSMSAGDITIYSIRLIRSGEVGTTPPINIPQGHLVMEGGAIENHRETPAVMADRITMTAINNSRALIFNQRAISPVRVTREMRIGGAAGIGSFAESANFVPPIDSTSNANVYIEASNFMMLGRTRLQGESINAYC